MLNYLLLGACIALALLGLRGRWRLTWIKPVLIAAGIVALVALLVAQMSRRTMGGDAWYDHEAFVYLVTFLMLLFGIVSSTLVHAIVERKAKLAQYPSEQERKQVKLAVDRYDFLYAFLISVPTYGALLAQFPEKKLTIVLLTLSYETGFFWDAVLGVRKERLTASAQSGAP